jgi:hypothetical protein
MGWLPEHWLAGVPSVHLDMQASPERAAPEGQPQTEAFCMRVELCVQYIGLLAEQESGAVPSEQNGAHSPSCRMVPEGHPQ